MSSTQPLELRSLHVQDLFNVCYDSAGQLMLVQSDKIADLLETPQTGSHLSTQSIRKLTVREQAHLKAAFYWLNVYKPEPNASNLEQVRGYLEAFHHLCEISAWESAKQLLFTSTKTGNAKELYEQLRSWGYYSELIELYSRLVGKLNLETDCFCLRGLGGAYSHFGQVLKAMNYHNRELEIAREIGNKLAEAQALGELGGVYSSLGQHKTALSYLQQKLAVAREIRATKEEGLALGGLGSLHIFKGNYRRGIKYSQQALVIAREIGDREMEGLVLMWLGGTHISRRRYKQAIAYLQQQLSISTQTGNRCQHYSALYYLGCSYFLLGQAQAAIECLNQALVFARETASRTTEAAILSAMAGVYCTCLKQYEDAIECLEQVLRIYREMGNRAKEANATSDLSYCYGCLRQHAKAIEYSQQALAIACETGDREAKASALASLASVYRHQKQYVRALWLVAQSLMLLPPWASPNGEIVFRETVKEITHLFKQFIGCIPILYR